MKPNPTLRAMRFTPAILVVALASIIAVPLNAANILDAEAVWRPEVEQLYCADVYHSRNAAIEYLARGLGRHLESTQQQVEFSLDDHSEIVDLLKAAMTSAGLKIGDSGSPIYISIDSDGEHGVLRLSTSIEDEPFSIMSEFADKPWVDRDSPPDSNLVVVRGTIDSAESAIYQAADQHILPIIFEHPRLRSASGWERHIAGRRVRKGLEGSPIIADRFQQTFYKTIEGERHEAFSREAILLDLSEENLTDIVHSVRRDLRRGKRVRSEAFSFATIAVVIACFVCWLGYTFFNRVTQGYYVWPIRLVTTVVLLTTLSLAAGITFSILNSL